ncbi:MAG: DinB family protein [Anaerolineales bacterium]|nr:DinB family protein [Anaerolineales bacterium]
MNAINPEHFSKAISSLLNETFTNSKSYYLDPGTSLFETLEGITAEEASIPVGGKCATLAAQVKHTAFFLDVVDKSARDPDFPPVDWGEIWQSVNQVTSEEWDTIRAGLRASYERILELLADTTDWPSEREIGGAIAIIAHSAYHLGEIRQALCTLREKAD